MKLVIASDHAGFALKEEVRAYLTQAGTRDGRPGRVQRRTRRTTIRTLRRRSARPSSSGEAPRGILICGSGVGVCVAANKIPGIRAGMCHDTYSAHQGVEHDDMNVIVLRRAHHRLRAGLRTGRRIHQGEVHLQRRTVYAPLQEGAGHRSEVQCGEGSTSKA